MVAFVGRPNVGKSTLVNRIVGVPVSIVSRRPQTTRHRILGIKTTDAAQVVYVDTPGLHAPEGRQFNRYLSRLARGSVAGVDAVLLMISADGWHVEDERALEVARSAGAPVVLVINKIDRLADRARLLPLTEDSASRFAFAEIVPLSARSGDNVPALERALVKYLPAQPPAYAAQQRTDKSERFRAGETVRAQILALYAQEIPHAAAVEVTRFKRTQSRLDIEAVIWMEKEGQKAILIGKGGERLKQVGVRARHLLEKEHGVKVNLRLWVKVRKAWSDDARALQRFGYHEDAS
jgi:GTP-binding protein Era